MKSRGSRSFKFAGLVVLALQAGLAADSGGISGIERGKGRKGSGGRIVKQTPPLQ